MPTYHLVIGTKTWSSWSLRPWLALKAAEVPFEEIVVPLRTPSSAQRLRELSPTGRVPALLIDGRRPAAVFDSLAICELAADLRPDRGLWPDDVLARAAARSCAAEMHSGFQELRETLPMAFAQRAPTPDLNEAVMRQIARILEVWTGSMERFGAEGGFLFGRFSIADCMYAPVVSRFLTYGVAVPDRVRGYMERMWALPAMREWGAAVEREAAAGLRG